MVATAAEAPSSKSIVDRDSGTILWSTTTRDTRPLFKLGQLPDSKRRMRFELYTCLGSDKTGVLRQVPAPDANRRVREEELVARHAYFTKMADGYYYWDYQKIRREYGILEFGLDPKDPQSRGRIGGLPAVPHPWWMPDGSSQADIDDLVVFLLTL